jgi:hypothetical protein
VGFVVDEVALGQAFPGDFGCLVDFHSTNRSVFVNHFIVNVI